MTGDRQPGRRNGKRMFWHAVVVIAVAMTCLAAFNAGHSASTDEGSEPYPFGAVALQAGAVLYTVSFAAGLVYRRRLLTAAARSTVDAVVPVIDPYEAALIARDSPLDPSRVAVNIAVAALVCDKSLIFDEAALATSKTKYRLRAVGPLMATPHPLERAVYDEVAQNPGGILLSDVHAKTTASVGAIESALTHRGLLVDESFKGRQRLLLSLPLLAAAASIVAGAAMTHHMLVLGYALWVLLPAIIFVIWPPMGPTDLGAEALHRERTRQPRYAQVGRETVANGRSLAWILALQGFSVLVGGSLGLLFDAMTAPEQFGGGAPNPSNGGG